MTLARVCKLDNYNTGSNTSTACKLQGRRRRRGEEHYAILTTQYKHSTHNTIMCGVVVDKLLYFRDVDK